MIAIPVGHGGYVFLEKCRICRALVLRDDIAAHEEWHKK